MKKLITVFVSLMFLLLVACGGKSENNNAAEENDQSAETSEETTDIEDTENTEDEPYLANEDEAGTRTNPKSQDDTIEFQVATYSSENDEYTYGQGVFSVNGVFRGQDALDIMNSSENDDFEPYEEEGYEWAVIDIKFILEKFDNPDKSYYFTPDWVEIYDMNGKPAPGVEPMFSKALMFESIYEGATEEGYIGKVVPKNKPLLIKYDDFHGQEVWMEIK